MHSREVECQETVGVLHMTRALLKIKLMPESLDTDLAEIQLEIHNKLKEASNITIEEQEVAFGLKALVVSFAIPEEKGTDEVEASLSKIKGVSSVEIIDYRREFG